MPAGFRRAELWRFPAGRRGCAGDTGGWPGQLGAASGGRRRHRCGSSCATGAGRTAPAAGNGTEYRCTPAQGVRRDRIGTPQTKKAARTGSLYLVTQPDYRAILTLKFRDPSF